MENRNRYELSPCLVKFSVKLTQVSEKLSVPVKNAVKEGKNLEKEFRFFVPSPYREINQEEISLSSGPVVSCIKELEEWISEYYGSFIAPEYRLHLANHGVAHVLRLCPNYSITSSKFRSFCLFWVIAFILDDWFDESTSEVINDNSKQIKKVQYLEMIGKALEEGLGTSEKDSQDLDDFNKLKKQVLNMSVLKEHPFLLIMANSWPEIFNQIQDANAEMTLKKFVATFKLDFLQIFEAFRWDFVNKTLGTLDSYCLDTCRYFKSVEAGLPIFLNIISILEGFELPVVIKSNPIFIQWRYVCSVLVGILNDLLGLQKDLRHGEEDGMIMLKMRKGLSLNNAVDEELKLLSEYVDDYGKLRDSLLTAFPGKEELLSCIEFAEGWLYGSLYTFKDSVKYGMRDQIHVQHL